MLNDLVSRPRDVSIRQFLISSLPVNPDDANRHILRSLSPSLTITSFRLFTVHFSTPNFSLTARATNSAPCARVNSSRGRMIEKLVLPSSWNTVPPPDRRRTNGIDHFRKSRGVVSFHGFYLHQPTARPTESNGTDLITTNDYAWAIAVEEEDRLIPRGIAKKPVLSAGWLVL